MPDFVYNGLDGQGTPVQGSVSAADIRGAAEIVRLRGVIVTRLEPVQPLSVTASAPTLMDLSQPIPAMEAAMAGETRRLEPWERSVGQNLPEALIPAAVPVGPPSAEPRRNLEAVRAPETGLAERFKEAFVYPVTSGVRLSDIVPFYRQFAALVRAGIPLYQCLTALEANTNNARLKEIAHAGLMKVQSGGRFSDVMAANPWVFPPMHVALVRAAEQGGMMDDVLLEIASYTEHELDIRRVISRETLYPKIVVFVAIMIFGRGGFGGGTLDVVQLVMGKYTVADYLMNTIGMALMFLLPIFGATVAFRLFLYNIPGVREGYDRFKFLVPGVGKLVRMFAVARFIRTYAALYKAGFSMSSSLEMSGDACGNAVMAAAGRQAALEAERGGLVSDALQRTGLFPNMALDMLRTGEMTGGLDQLLAKAAQFYEEEGKTKSHQLALIVSVGVFLIVAIMVGIQIIGFYQGSANAVNSAGDG